MRTQNLGVTQKLFSPKILVDKKLNYVMQGKAKEKTLDIYHLILAPTYACNLRCKHCYLPDHGRTILPKDVVLRLVDEWSEIVLVERGEYGGIFHVKGGEPFMVPYLWDITNRLVELKSLRFMITTNGTFVEDDIFKRLRDCSDALKGHVAIIVSLDGATEETHTILRGKRQFAKILRFLKELRKYGLTFYLNFVLHKGNIYELSAYIDLAKEYGAAQINFLSFIPRGIGSGFCQFQVPHFEVYRQLDAIYKNGDGKTKELLTGSLPHIKHHEALGRCQTSGECVAAYRGLLYITPNGNTYTCPNIVFPEFSVGNIFRQSLKEISENLKALRQELRNHNRPYTCTGEKILYEKNDDVENQVSLKNFQNNCENTGEEKSNNGVLMSYCYNRNY